MMKLLLVILGALLLALGLVILGGTAIGILDGTSEYSVATDLLGAIAIAVPICGLGLALLAAGIILAFRRPRQASNPQGATNEGQSFIAEPNPTSPPADPRSSP
jgi:hypothetical protein